MKDLSFLKSQIDPSKPGPLNHLAFRSEMSKGRKWPKEKDEDGWMFDLFDPFVIDRHKIEFSKALRRLDNKTQVFSLQNNNHVRDRLTHTTEVAGLAAIIARALGLNVDLCVDQSEGHDVGHVPFGHVGEIFIAEKTQKDFKHAKYGAILLQEMERKGLANFSFEVLEGISLHSSKFIPENKPQEYKVTKLSDKIAFVLHDINDAIRMRILSENITELKLLGQNHRERLGNCITALLSESIGRGFVSFEISDTAKCFWSMYEWMYNNVYNKIDTRPWIAILETTYGVLTHESQNPNSFFFKHDPVIMLSLMNDLECSNLYKKVTTFQDHQDVLKNLTMNEILPSLQGREINWENPDFSWAEKK